MKKGALLTFDAMVAMIATVIMLFVILSSLHDSQRDTQGTEELQHTSFQVMSAASHTGVLVQGLSSATPVKRHLNATIPSRMCSTITLYDNSNATVRNVNKTGCENQTPSKKSVSVRSFRSGGANYYAILEVWYDG